MESDENLKIDYLYYIGIKVIFSQLRIYADSIIHEDEKPVNEGHDIKVSINPYSITDNYWKLESTDYI